MNTAWEPNAHLRCEAVRPERENAMASSQSEPHAIDWYLEHQGGIARPHGGFRLWRGADWDQEYE